MNNVHTFMMEPVSYKCVRPFIEKWHYSSNTNGIKIYQCFGLFRDTEFGFSEMIGAMIYGYPAMNNQAAKWNPTDPSKCIELRRLCCIDDTPKNTESYFIGKTLKWLRKNSDIEMIVSYADPAFNHSGTIYKATNFKYNGLTSAGVVLMYNGKRYHDRTLRMKKPYADKIRKEYNLGNVQVVKTPGKHIYTYKLR